jgi:phage-related protein
VAVGALATAAVDVVANLDTFEPDLKRKLESAIRTVSKSVEKDFDKLGARSGKSFTDALSKVVESTEPFDKLGKTAEQAERTVVSAARGMSDSFKLPLSDVQKLERAVQSATDSESDALGNVRVAQEQLTEARKRYGDESSHAVAAEEKLAKAQRNSARESQRLLDVTDSLIGALEKSRLVGEESGAAAGGGFGDGFRREASKGADDGGRESGGFFARAFETAASKAVGGVLLKTFAAGIGSLITAASPLSTVLGGGVAAVVALAAALGQASGAAISLGGVLGALGLAVGTLKLGFSGVGDAVKAQSKAYEELAATGKVSAATQKQLDAALKNLAPSAAAVVKQLGAMRPAWEGIRRTVQGNLFAGVSDSLRKLGSQFLPILSTQLGTAATTINGVARQFLAFISTGNRANQINTIFTGLNGILKTLLQPLTTLAGGFLDIFTASLPFAQQLATVLSSIGTSFGTWLGKVADSDGFQTFMQNAMQTAGVLFQLLGNIGSIIGSVFGAGAATGGNLLSILRDLTGEAALFLNSAAGKEALASFFGLVAQAGKILVGVFKTLSPLLSGIGALFQALQPALQALGTALIPVIAQLATTLGAAFATLGPIIAQLVVALTPLVTTILSLFVTQFQSFLPVVVALVSGLVPLVSALVSGLVPAFAQLAPLAAQLAPILLQVVQAFIAGLLPVIQAIVPLIPQLVGGIVQLVAAFLPLIPALIPLIGPASQLSLALVQMILALTPLIPLIVQAGTEIAAVLIPAVIAVVPYILQVVQNLIGLTNAITKVVGFVVNLAVIVQGKFNEFRNAAIAAVSSMVSAVVGFFSSLPGKIGTFMSAFAEKVNSGIKKAIEFFASLPGKAVAALSGLGGQLKQAGSDAIQGLIDGLSGGLQRVQDIAGKIASAVSGPVAKFLKIGSPSKLMAQYGAWTVEGFGNGMVKLIPFINKTATRVAKTASDSIKRQIGNLEAVGTRAANVLTASVNAVDSKIKTASGRLADLVKQSRDLAQQVAQSIVSTGDITKSQDQSFSGIVTSLREAVLQAATFNTTIARLKAAGLGETALQQIIAAGPETGSKIGQAILGAGKAGIAQINKLQTTLNRAANQAGVTAANSLYAAGISAAKGLVAGLQQQKTALDAQMIRLGGVLAQSLAKVLGVKSLPGVKIPGFARGTIVDRPTLGMIGEGRSKEAVIPLDGSQRSADLMDQSGLTQQALERALGNQGPTTGGGKTREVHMPVNVAGLTKEETVAILRDFLQNTFGPRLGLDTAEGAV